MNDPYNNSQQAIATLKGAIHTLLTNHPQGLKNAQIGQMLGIHKGHGNQHAGHITRTLLEIMQNEGTVIQSKSKLWNVCNPVNVEDDYI